MPRLKKPESDPVVRLIWGELHAQQMTVKQLSEKTKISQYILTQRKRCPDDFTLGEIKKICRTIPIPIDEMRLAIRLRGERK